MTFIISLKMSLKASFCILAFLTAIFMIAPSGFGYSIDSYQVLFEMDKDVVSTEVNITFSERVSERLGFSLPPGSKIISAKLDNETIKAETTRHQEKDSLLELNFENTQTLYLQYETSYYIDNDDF